MNQGTFNLMRTIVTIYSSTFLTTHFIKWILSWNGRLLWLNFPILYNCELCLRRWPWFNITSVQRLTKPLLFKWDFKPEDWFCRLLYILYHTQFYLIWLIRFLTFTLDSVCISCLRWSVYPTLPTIFLYMAWAQRSPLDTVTTSEARP